MSLTVKHLFPFLKLMKALNIREDFKQVFKNRVDVSEMTDDDKNQLLQERGLDMVLMLMEKMPTAEKEIKSFLALYSDKSLDDIENMPVEDFIDLIKQFFAEPQFKSFFTQAVK
jgi:hypothetical protein